MSICFHGLAPTIIIVSFSRTTIFLNLISDLDFLVTWANHFGSVILVWIAKELLYHFNCPQISVLEGLDTLHGEIQVLPCG